MPAGRSQSPRFAAESTSKAASPPITSKDNRWLKRFRAALAGECDEPNAVGIEVPHLLEEALLSGAEIRAVLVSPAGEKHIEHLGLVLAGHSAGGEAEGSDGPPLLRTTDRLFEWVAATEAPQGIAALVRLPEYTFDDLVRGLPLVLVLVGVQDPGNVGTLIRSAEAFGATGLIATAGTASPLGPKAIRASAGSIFRLPVVARTQPAVALAQLRVAGVKLVATTAVGAEAAPVPVSPTGGGPGAAGTPVSPHEVDLRQPVALLVGAEARGLPQNIVSSADLAVRIPLASSVESLNAAVAASVVLYEAARQRERQP